MTPDDIVAVLEAHALWLRGKGGARADLARVDLTRANLSGANLSGASLTGADLTHASLTGASIRDADLTHANLTRASLTANLSGSDLTDASLTGASLRDADLYRANLTRADLAGADISGADLTGAEGLPSAPVVPDIHAAIYAAASKQGALDMSDWHTCETTHCRAGWAITLAGDAGRELEARLGPSVAGALIYLASDPSLTTVPDWHASDSDALADMARLAGR